MEILYIGSICDNEVFAERTSKSKIKPSAAPQAFEGAILKGFRALDGVSLTVLSAESIAPYPHGNKLLLKARKDIVEGYEVNIVPAINLPLLKQLTHAKNTKRRVKKWLNKTKGTSRCVLMYGIYPLVAKEVIEICHKNDCKVVPIVTDVPAAIF